MSLPSFFRQLSMVSLGVGLLLLLLQLIPPIAPYWQLSWGSWCLFISLSICLYYLGRLAATSPNKQAFTALSMSVMLIKLVASLAFLLTYHKTVQPIASWGLLPFFIVYLFYSAFEVSFMAKLARM